MESWISGERIKYVSWFGWIEPISMMMIGFNIVRGDDGKAWFISGTIRFFLSFLVSSVKSGHGAGIALRRRHAHGIYLIKLPGRRYPGCMDLEVGLFVLVRA